MRTIRITSIVIVLFAVFGLSAFGGKAAPLHVPTNPGITSLIGWWSLNETAGIRYDSYGVNHLTDNNTVSYSGGMQGNAAYFIKENSEYLSIADNDNLSTSTTVSYSMGCWTNHLSSSSLPLIGKGAVSTQKEYTLRFAVNNTYGIYVSSDGVAYGTSYIDTGVMSVGNWNFVVAWHTPGTSYIQINNGVVYSGSTQNSSNRTGPFNIGSDSGLYFDGLLDECFFYKKILSADEREYLYNSGVGREYCEIASTCPTPTPIPPTATFTALPPTATRTPTATAIPPTATFTALPPTATHTPTASAILPTATFTATATDIPPTATETLLPTITNTPTNTFTPTITNTPYPTRTPGNMATAFWDGAITYGDAANVSATALLCLVTILGIMAFLVISTVQRRKK